MQRHGRDQIGVGQQLGAGAHQPATERRRGVGAIGVLERRESGGASRRRSATPRGRDRRQEDRRHRRRKAVPPAAHAAGDSRTSDIAAARERSARASTQRTAGPAPRRGCRSRGSAAAAPGPAHRAALDCRWSDIQAAFFNSIDSRRRRRQPDHRAAHSAGLLLDPGQIVRVAAADRHRDHGRALVAVAARPPARSVAAPVPAVFATSMTSVASSRAPCQRLDRPLRAVDTRVDRDPRVPD